MIIYRLDLNDETRSYIMMLEKFAKFKFKKVNTNFEGNYRYYLFKLK